MRFLARQVAPKYVESVYARIQRNENARKIGIAADARVDAELAQIEAAWPIMLPVAQIRKCPWRGRIPSQARYPACGRRMQIARNGAAFVWLCSNPKHPHVAIERSRLIAYIAHALPQGGA